MRAAWEHDAETCFFERDQNLAVARRALVEAVGTLLLMFAVVGSGLVAEHLFGTSPEIGLMVSAIATAGALVGLILAFGAVSGGHFNPLISGLQWLAGERRLDCTIAYVVAQCGGGIAGALLANLVFGVERQLVTPVPASWPLVSSEIVAAAGLMLVVFGCARGGRSETGPFAVGAWLAAAIVAMPSASYANPAIVLGAIFAAGPAGLSPTIAALYPPAEFVGALIAFLIIAIAYPRRAIDAPRIAVMAAPDRTAGA